MNGVYFLANDRVFDLALAFLESFRLHSPALPLLLIPYDDQTERMRSLAPIYRFGLHEEPETLRLCDQIGDTVLGRRCGAFRKLAAWNGPFDRFAYIDIDTIILRDINTLFRHLSEYEFVAAQSHLSGSERWVWKDSIHQRAVMSRAQIAFAANSGLFVAQRGDWFGSFTAAETVRAAVRLRDDMELHCMEQPFLNYCVVTSGMRYSSLTEIKRTAGDPQVCLEQWAGSRGGRIKAGTVYFPGRPPVLLMHWAGKWHPTRLERWWQVLLRLAGGGGRPPARRRFMPYRALWEHYWRRGLAAVREGARA